MTDPACPECGEGEDLRGEVVGDDIEVACLTCGTTFRRGTPSCRQCGRTDPVHGTQRMTRFARGTLLAVVGMREVPLCRSCDGDVAASVLDRSQLIPEGYASRFVCGEILEALTVPKPTARRAPPTPRPPIGPAPIPRGQGLGSPSVADQAAPVSSHPQDPTVRQATEAFLGQAREPTDSLCLVLLGTELGASTRLSSLDHQTGEAIALWVDSRFGKAATRRELATATITDLVDHCLREGWLSTDIAATLR